MSLFSLLFPFFPFLSVEFPHPHLLQNQTTNKFIFKARLKSLPVSYLVGDTFIGSGNPTFIRFIRHFIKSVEIFSWCFLNSWATFVNKIWGQKCIFTLQYIDILHFIVFPSSSFRDATGYPCSQKTSLYYLHFVVKLLSVNIFSNRPSILSFLSLREIFWKKKQIKIKPKFPAVKYQQTSRKKWLLPDMHVVVNFHLTLFLFFLCFSVISIHYHTQKQNKKLPEIKSILRFLTMKHDIHSTELEDIQYSVRFRTNSLLISCIKNKPAR